jgi:hypothetical protein
MATIVVVVSNVEDVEITIAIQIDVGMQKSIK